ncbi:hypothetical protein BD410DRAFT_896611 [Rickenella mellea]|uniref:Monopolin complex subunit Csm1/Pcs1 C-terminal domain-containing protein n=1 Tax=Rickenella mellea TaxID=50990 RepID=A0A4Y7QBJ3_9AGAM|nr:hypothetical protein BD410DRAFT_896611 [Rickenella mellea]
MADSDDEFENIGFQGTTPVKVEKPPSRAKSNGRAVAGPSNTNSKPKTGRTRSNEPTNTIAQASVVPVEVSDTEEIEYVSPPQSQPQKPATARTGSKGKAPAGTAKKPNAAVQPPTKRGPPSVVEVMDVDEEDATVRKRRAGAQPSRGTGNQRTRDSDWKEEEKKLRIQLARVEDQLQTVDANRQQLVDQLEEAFHTRHTEAEEAMLQQAKQYEIRLKTQEEMIQELTSQLARVDALTREGKTSTLHFLTREAAEEERRGIEREVERLKDQLKQKDVVIAERDRKIVEHEGAIQVLRSDLKAEIENTKMVTSRHAGREPPSSATRGRSQPHHDDPKVGQAVRLYEDLTNLLVLDVQLEKPGTLGKEDILFRCIFSHRETTNGLNFTLREYCDFDDPSETERFTKKVMYTPYDLDKEPDQEYVEKLDFLSTQFTFNYTQLPVFLKSLNDAMERVTSEETADEEDE